MTASQGYLTIEPTPQLLRLLASEGTHTWIATRPPHYHAYLLLTHPAGILRCDNETIEARMRGLAAALQLTASDHSLHDIGDRLHLHNAADVTLSLDGCPHQLLSPVDDSWARCVSAGGPVTVAVGLEALPAKASRAVVRDYCVNSWSAGRLLLGTTWARSTP
ncbi:hypothetical protein [Streptomyces sp. WM6378]|uniref:hypothetical protein n=1 Tax=Streptomyces sp. WM6378 TaxID=1415557 RepID=UPI0006AFC1D8|nr:hypothetical protein [Streptomyces sp. WM6378]